MVSILATGVNKPRDASLSTQCRYTPSVYTETTESITAFFWKFRNCRTFGNNKFEVHRNEVLSEIRNWGAPPRGRIIARKQRFSTFYMGAPADDKSQDYLR